MRAFSSSTTRAREWASGTFAALNRQTILRWNDIQRNHWGFYFTLYSTFKRILVFKTESREENKRGKVPLTNWVVLRVRGQLTLKKALIGRVLVVWGRGHATSTRCHNTVLSQWRCLFGFWSLRLKRLVWASLRKLRAHWLLSATREESSHN